MALYIFYEGKDVMERWNIYKHNITTDTDEEEGIMSLEEKYDDELKNIVKTQCYFFILVHPTPIIPNRLDRRVSIFSAHRPE